MRSRNFSRELLADKNEPPVELFDEKWNLMPNGLKILPLKNCTPGTEVSWYPLDPCLWPSELRCRCTIGCNVDVSAVVSPFVDAVSPPLVPLNACVDVDSNDEFGFENPRVMSGGKITVELSPVLLEPSSSSNCVRWYRGIWTQWEGERERWVEVTVVYKSCCQDIRTLSHKR